VLVRSEVLGTIGDCAVAGASVETGGPLIGTVARSWGHGRVTLIVSVLGTVPPGPAVVGTPASVSLGVESDGERAASALRWWRAVTRLELVHLGDWHLHPDGLPEPSRGDEMTACRMDAERSTPIWLAGIATPHAPPRFHRAGLAGLALVGVRVDDDAIPGLPGLPWHITDPPRFAAECRLLHAAGYTSAIGPPADPVAAGDRPGVTLRVRRNGGPALTVVTGPRYPYEPPAALDERGRRVALPGVWCAERFLVDLLNGAS
jgi:hypothetical protein